MAVIIVEPTNVFTKELENLNLEVRLYDSSVMLLLRKKEEPGYLVFSRTYEDYNVQAIQEVEDFVQNYDNEIKFGKSDKIKKMYYTLANHNW